MLKHLLGFILFILLYNSVYSQAKSDTLMYYVRDDGSVVPNKENADYVLFILPKEEINNKKLYPIVGYYLDGKLKFSATSKTQSTDFVLEGSYITYFPNGKRRIIATSENGEAVGDEIAYYPNGNFYTHIKHERHQTVLFECRDSTGIVLAQNGNGNWKEFDNSFKIKRTSKKWQQTRRMGNTYRKSIIQKWLADWNDIRETNRRRGNS